MIPKASRRERLEENFAAAEENMADAAEILGDLDELNVDHHFCWNPENIL